MDDARAAYWSHAHTMGRYEYAAHWDLKVSLVISKVRRNQSRQVY